MNPSLGQLRAFVAVADAGSFTEAARRLHLTQSATSLLVKQLETTLRLRLLDRSTRSTRVSPAGADFLPHARAVLDELERAIASSQRLARKERGRVLLACTPLYAAGFVPDVVARFASRYPDVAVRVLDSLNEQALARVAAGEADLAIAPQRPTPPDLSQEALFRDRIDLVCRADHPLAARRHVGWRQVLAHPFVTLTPDFTARLQADLHASSPSLTLEPAMEVALSTTALGLVRAGRGVTALPSQAVPLLPGFGLVRVPLREPVVHRQVSVFTRRGQSLSPAAASLLETMREAT